MKKNLIHSLYLIIATFIISSCGNKLALTKRHYNKGYYVESNKNIKSGIVENKQSTLSKTSIEIANVVDKNKSNSYKNVFDYKSNNLNDVTVNNKEKTTFKINTKTKKINQRDKITLINKLKKINVSIGNVQSFKLSAANEDTDSGFSLFWIVILVLLLLWLFGYILLSGGLINLVLALALVLLILWLLRII